jgi:uncharacterized protein (TIGR00369 family)
MPQFQPQDPEYESRVRASFARQRVMLTIGARMGRVAPGEVEIELPYRADLTQQHGFLHAGIVTTILDSACGYAAFSLMPADASVLSVEYKVNFVAPARGRLMIARGRVTKPGRAISVCAGDVFAAGDAGETLVATMLATMIALYDRRDLPE